MPQPNCKSLPPRWGVGLNPARPEVAALFPSATSGYPLPTLRVDLLASALELAEGSDQAALTSPMEDLGNAPGLIAVLMEALHGQRRSAA